jgi:hypothetical protein
MVLVKARAERRDEMTADKIKYYDASPNPDHFTKEQIERVIEALDTDEPEVCRECGKSEAGSCFYCKMD